MRTGGHCRTVDREISRFPRKERLHMPGSSTTPGRSDLAMVRPKRVAFRTRNGVGTRGLAFAAQWLAYALPLPTLRRRPRGRQRTARGRCGSLLLHRSGLAPPTPCRSPGALRVLHAQPRSRVSLARLSRSWALRAKLQPAIRLRAMTGKAVVLAPRLCRCPARDLGWVERAQQRAGARAIIGRIGKYSFSPLLPSCPQ